MRDFGDKRSTTWERDQQATAARPAPGKQALTEMLPPASAPVQRKAAVSAPEPVTPTGPRPTIHDLFGGVHASGQRADGPTREHVPGKPTLAETPFRQATSAPALVDPDAAFGAATRHSGGEIPHRAEMERAFGQDFGGVTAHTGRRELGLMGAAAAARSEQVAFADASPGREVVAHEFAHVVQQRQAGGGGAVQGKGVSDPSDAAEREADQVAACVVGGERVTVGAPPSLGLHRVTPGELAPRTAEWTSPEFQKKLHKHWRETVEVPFQSFEEWVEILSVGTALQLLDDLNDDDESDVNGGRSRGGSFGEKEPKDTGVGRSRSESFVVLDEDEVGSGRSRSRSVKPDDGKGSAKLVEAQNMVSDAPEVDAAMVKSIGEDSLEGAMLCSHQILARWPASKHVYIGVGRSPALITAYLDSLGCTTCTVPLSSFKHGAVTTFGSNRPLDKDQEAQLASHFDGYLIKPMALAGRDIVVIDFVMNGPGAIASYNYIHRYYTGPTLRRPDRDAFYESGDLMSRWEYEYDKSNFATLQIRLAVLCARSNRAEIQRVIELNVDDDRQFEEEELGDVSRLCSEDDYLLVTPQDKREDVLMGKLDAEALKGYSKHGKQSEPSMVARESYLKLVELFRAYRLRSPVGSPGAESSSKEGPSREHKEKLPEPEELLPMLESGIGLGQLQFERDGKRGGPMHRDLQPASPRPSAAASASQEPPKSKLPVESIKKLRKVIEQSLPVVNGELFTGDSARVEPIKAVLVVLLTGLRTATTLEELIACLTGVKDKLEALGKALSIKTRSRRIAEDVATRADTLLANATRRSQRG